MRFKDTILGILISCLFCGCKTPPVQKVLAASPSRSVLSENNSKLKIYFPEFYDENGKVYNGDGTVIILPDDKVIVIDGFKPGAAEQYIAFLHSLNITRIDYLIATHYHADHIGTFPELIQNFEIGVFYSNGAPIDNSASPLLLDAIKEKQIEHIILKEGDDVEFCPEVTAHIFWPTLTEQDLYDVMYNPGRTEAKINLTSLVTKITYNNFTILFPGDCYKKGEKALVEKYGDQLKSTILKCSHHGEWYTANLPLFVQTVSPEYGIIQDNRYITNVISNIYKKAGAKILYRLTPGYMLIETDGINYTISETSY